jgi:hypothetical protein
VDRRYISNADDSFFPFDNAIVIGMEMDKVLVMEIPFTGFKSKGRVDRFV